MVPRFWMLVTALAVGNAWAQAPVAARPGADQALSGAAASVDSASVDAALAAVPTPAPVDQPTCAALCAGSLVELEVVEPVSSARHKNGDRFALRLVAPLVAGGVELVPAGTVGIGEVVHASPSRGGGKPGELLLAARYLEPADGRRIALRAMKLSARGKDMVNSSLATSFVIGPLAMFVRGTEIEIPAGTLAMAKLAQDIPPSSPTPLAPPADVAPQPAADAMTSGDAPPTTPRPPEVPEGTVSQP